MELYVAAPDTADLPRDSDWPIAGAMYDSGIPLDAVELAFHIAFLRRYLVNLERDGYSPRIRSLAYFRAVINSFSPAERDPAYMAYIASSYANKRDNPEGYLRRFANPVDKTCPSQ
jgi:hypothetical protein